MSFMRSGPSSMLKDGATFVEEPVLKNIAAARELTKITRSSMGPNGLCKLVINHIGKLLVTHDTAAILHELEVEHPAAKLLVMAAKAMQDEVGDGTNLVVSLAGELLSQAESLIRMGLHPSDVLEGYKRSSLKALEILDTLSCGTVTDCLSEAAVIPAIRTAVGSKLYGYEHHIAEVVASACVSVCPTDPSVPFSVDHVRVCKLDGDTVLATRALRGFVVARNAEGTVRRVAAARVAVYGCAVDVPSTETKGTALIESAADLQGYSKKEEDAMEAMVRSIAAMGVSVVVTSSTFGDLALHYLNLANILALKVTSKFDLARLCRAVGARSLPSMAAPTAEDIGECDAVDVREIGGKYVTVFEQTSGDSKLSTIIVRGATQNVRDDVERAVEDGINVFRALNRDRRLVAGAGACEMELQRQLAVFAEHAPGLDQYAMHKFATSFEVVARTLAEVSGFNATDVVTALQAAHVSGHPFEGVGIADGQPVNAVTAGVVEPLVLKMWAIRLATDAALTVLTVDQIIVAKQAGGPKMRPDQARDEE